MQRTTENLTTDTSHPVGADALDRVRMQVEGLSYKRTRWAKFRETNVDDLLCASKDDRLRVTIFDDPKLKRADHQLVLLHKQTFDDIAATLHAVLVGQVAVAAKFQQFTKLVGVLKRISVDGTQGRNFQELADVACTQAQELSTFFVVPEQLHPADEYTPLDERGGDAVDE